MSFLTKPMLLINFVIDFFTVSCAVFEIKTVTPNLVTRWRCNRFPWIAHGNFTIPRPNFFDYSSCRSEIIGVTTDFSRHTVYKKTVSDNIICILKQHISQMLQICNKFYFFYYYFFVSFTPKQNSENKCCALNFTINSFSFFFFSDI